MTTDIEPKTARYLRGLVLRLIYLNHNRQRARLSSTQIRGALQIEGYNQFGRDDVLTVLQDLKDRGYVRYKQMRDADERVYLFEIELTAQGRDLCDLITEDPAVLVQ